MRSFEELRRGRFRPDAVAKAAEQEAFDRQVERTAGEGAGREDAAGGGSDAGLLAGGAPVESASPDRVPDSPSEHRELAESTAGRAGAGRAAGQASAGSAVASRAVAESLAGASDEPVPPSQTPVSPAEEFAKSAAVSQAPASPVSADAELTPQQPSSPNLTDQSFDQLSRDSFRPDAAAKAAEQEAYERTLAQREARRRQERQVPVPAPAMDDVMRDQVDPAVAPRADGPQDEVITGGGAVISRRSELAALVSRLGRAGWDRLAHLKQGRRTGTPRKPHARETDKRSRSRKRSRLETCLIALAAIAVLYLVFCLPIDHTISFTREERKGLSHELSFHVPTTPYYLLIMGSDARPGEAISRTDTMILARVDLLGGKITMLSIPRDTKVVLERDGTQKINAAYAFGGVAGAVKAVHDLTGAPISQAAIIRFEGVETLVDHLGGVTVNVPVAVNDPEYTGLVLPTGETEMDGHTALLFSRVRHGFDLGDYQRQKDQRLLIEAIVNKSLSLPPWELPGVVGHMGGLVGTSMRVYSILPLTLRLKVAGGPTIYQATVPASSAYIGGISYEVADEEKLAQMMDVIDKGGDPGMVLL